MKKPDYFRFYPEDFMDGVTYMTNEEIGMYIQLLCKQWTQGKIPKKRLGFLLGLEWVSVSDQLKAKFEEDQDHIWHPRLEEERLSRLRYIRSQQINGKKGGRPKLRKANPKPKKNPTLSYIYTDNKSIGKDSNKGVQGEKRKKNHIKPAEGISMTQREMDTLEERYGKLGASWMVQRLSNYKLSKGKRYKSDYRAILSWVVDAWEEHKAKGEKQSGSVMDTIRQQYGIS